VPFFLELAEAAGVEDDPAAEALRYQSSCSFRASGSMAFFPAARNKQSSNLCSQRKRTEDKGRGSGRPI
jgi:hypothetical protein